MPLPTLADITPLVTGTLGSIAALMASKALLNKNRIDAARAPVLLSRVWVFLEQETPADFRHRDVPIASQMPPTLAAEVRDALRPKEEK